MTAAELRDAHVDVDPIGPTSVRVTVDPMYADAWRRGRLAVYLRELADLGTDVVIVCNGNPIVVLGKGRKTA